MASGENARMLIMRNGGVRAAINTQVGAQSMIIEHYCRWGGGTAHIG